MFKKILMNFTLLFSFASTAFGITLYNKSDKQLIINMHPWNCPYTTYLSSCINIAVKPGGTKSCNPMEDQCTRFMMSIKTTDGNYSTCNDISPEATITFDGKECKFEYIGKPNYFKMGRKETSSKTYQQQQTDKWKKDEEALKNAPKPY